MSNYTKTTNFAAKDALSSGDPNKIVKGTEIDAEFNNIATAVATKRDSSQAITLTGDATGSGTTMGMTFLASGDTKFVGSSDLEYVDLIEDPTMIDATTPRVVGRVYPQLKAISIDDEEIVAATSYKSNRNWTLPHLACALEAPSGGTSTGLLAPNETAYVSIARHITARKRTEEELENHRQKLEELVGIRTQALSREIVEHKAAQQDLASSLKEKELLLKEVHRGLIEGSREKCNSSITRGSL